MYIWSRSTAISESRRQSLLLCLRLFDGYRRRRHAVPCTLAFFCYTPISTSWSLFVIPTVGATIRTLRWNAFHSAFTRSVTAVIDDTGADRGLSSTTSRVSSRVPYPVGRQRQRLGVANGRSGVCIHEERYLTVDIRVSRWAPVTRRLPSHGTAALKRWLFWIDTQIIL